MRVEALLQNTVCRHKRNGSGLIKLYAASQNEIPFKVCLRSLQAPFRMEGLLSLVYYSFLILRQSRDIATTATISAM